MENQDSVEQGSGNVSSVVERRFKASIALGLFVSAVCLMTPGIPQIATILILTVCLVYTFCSLNQFLHSLSQKVQQESKCQTDNNHLTKRQEIEKALLAGQSNNPPYVSPLQKWYDEIGLSSTDVIRRHISVTARDMACFQIILAHVDLAIERITAAVQTECKVQDATIDSFIGAQCEVGFGPERNRLVPFFIEKSNKVSALRNELAILTDERRLFYNLGLIDR